MNIQNHIDTRLLEQRKTTAIVVLVMGVLFLWMFFFGAIFIALGLITYFQYERLKKEFAFLRQYPIATFTQIGQALGLTPQKVRNDLNLAVAAKILVDVRLDTVREVLVYPTPPTPPVPREEIVAVVCPNCGANATVSTLRGGQCEYCDSRLTVKK